MLPGLPAGRLPRPSALQHRPAQRPPRVALGVASAAPPARRSEQLGTGQRQHRRQTSDASSADRHPAASTATGPAPAAAMYWRASSASSPPCCARPLPPAPRTRRSPAGTRPRPAPRRFVAADGPQRPTTGAAGGHWAGLVPNILAHAQVSRYCCQRTTLPSRKSQT